MLPLTYADEFDPQRATEAEIMSRAEKMRGRTFRELGLSFRAVAEGASANKGHVGGLVERHFRIRPNSESEPDFRAAGIELKAVPLRRAPGARGTLRSKERTSLTMIGYHELIYEQWRTATVRKKIAAILFVYYEHLTGTDALDFPVRDVVLWRIPDDLLAQCERDWSVVRKKVEDGMAHRISEGDGRVLGAATKGAGKMWVTQPNSKELAKPRAWAFKASLTTWIRAQHGRNATDEVSVIAALGVSPRASFEGAVIRRLREHAGRELREIAMEQDVVLGSAKAAPAFLIRRLLGLTNDRARVREFEQFGVEVKTVPVSESGRPLESMSFPRFVHDEVIHETWESSDLRSHLQRVLVVPLVRRYREESKESHRLGNVFIWVPSDEELEGIQAEWEMYVSLIRRGRADRLPKASETRFLHVRPKGRDGSDTESAPGGREVGKKCFWLNASFVETLISSHLPSGVLPTRTEGAFPRSVRANTRTPR